MGCNICALHPEHYKVYLQIQKADPCSDDDLFEEWYDLHENEWYVNTTYSHIHCIASQLKDSYYETDGILKELPYELQDFYKKIHDKNDGLTFLSIFESLQTNDIHVCAFINWLRFWNSKDAYYYVSI